MPEPLRFLTWNLQDGGGDQHRTEQQRYLTAERPDIFGLTELRGWEDDGWRALHDVEDATGTSPMAGETRDYRLHNTELLRALSDHLPVSAT
ncbi:endonuclease/exonuclease/phosphatase family protein [Streptomyces marincola]|uniref:hypothetical protein n=1 Tax=Streptomyces marincola TaxID=2878388 RepID=UPI001CF11AE2|nr:hypothetical protein [Streptomyces marincola]UCM91487.1 hypothetical protein LC193_28015 [Streptomyces marincola]